MRRVSSFFIRLRRAILLPPSFITGRLSLKRVFHSRGGSLFILSHFLFFQTCHSFTLVIFSDFSFVLWEQTQSVFHSVFPSCLSLCLSLMSFTLSFPHVFHAHYRASFTLRSFFHLSLSFSGRRQSTPSVSESETGFTCSSLLVPLVVPLSFTMERLSSSHALLLFFALSFTLLTHSSTLLCSLFHSSHTLFYSSSLSLSLFSFFL